jgi:hypothetical protein
MLPGAGCADSGEFAMTEAASEPTTQFRASAGASRAEVDLAAAKSAAPASGMMGSGGMMGMAGEAAPALVEGDAAVPALPRKIIYTAEIGLVVEDFPAAEATLNSLVRKYRGYIADMQLTGSPGVNRSARWKVRVPVDAFESFLSEAGSLGELERQQRGSADVSEEFYDLEARIRNKKVEEQRLIKILEENTGKIEEVLRVEAELSRVRGEVERMEGRIRVLDNLTSLTTVTIDVRERVKYDPPPPVAASFPTQVSRTFQESVDALLELGRRAVLVVVAVSVWLPLIVIGGLFAWVVARWGLRRLWRLAVRAWELAQRPMHAARPPSPPAA